VPPAASIPFFVGAITIELMLLCCCRSLSRQVPINFCLLGAFTAFFSVPIWMMVVQYTPGSTMAVMGATFAVTFALTMYACFTKTDFTMCYGLIIAMCVISLILIVASFFMSWVAWWHPFVSALLLLFYAFYLIYDTQLIVGNKKHSIDLDDYILGALILYVDIVGMFIELLALFGDRS
jgi:FtsH-binding integral membrane protein